MSNIIYPVACYSRRRRALTEYFRTIGNVFVPLGMACMIAVALWIAFSFITSINKSTRPMSKAVTQVNA